MYPVSEDFLTEIVSRTRNYHYSGTITNGQNTQAFTGEHILQGSGSVTRETTGDNTFRFGGGCAAELSIGFPVTYGNIDFSDYLVEGAKIELNFTLEIPEEEDETIPIGVFYVQSVKRGVSNKLEVVAYDSMYKLHKAIDFSQYVPPSTAVEPYSWLVFICDSCGVTFGHTQAEVEAMPNGDVGMIYKPTGTPDWFAMLQAVTEMMACFAYIGRDDVPYLRQYSVSADFTYTDGARYSASAEDFESFYTSIHGTAQDITVAESTDNGLRYETDNPFVFATTSQVETVYRTILDELVAIRYRPISISVLTNPALDPGDMVKITHYKEGSLVWTYDCPVMKISYALYGKCSIDGYGDNPNAKDTNGSVTRSLNGLTQTVIQNTVSIEELKQSAIKFLLPTSTNDNPISDGETNEIIQWVFECAEGAEIAVSATVAFYVATTAVTDTSYGDALCTITYKMDGTDIEEYTETYGDGDHVLTLSHILTMALAGIHTLSVEITMNGGDLT
jgi:hypothetical protein